MLKELVNRFRPSYRKRSTRRSACQSHSGRSFQRKRVICEPLEDRLLLTVFTSQDTPLAIPDPGVLASTITVENNGDVADVNVTLNIEHVWDEDLDVFLIGPDATRVELFVGVGSGGDDFDGTTLDDDAAESIDSGSSPFSGTFRPSGTLADFNDRSSKGDWTLEISDVFGGGTLKGLESKIGYLQRLGITAVWISPIFKQVPFRETYHGYGIQNYLDVDPRFGARDDLASLVETAHRHGIRHGDCAIMGNLR